MFVSNCFYIHIFETVWGKTCYKLQCFLKCCNFLGSFATSRPVSKCLFQLGNVFLFWNKGNVYISLKTNIEVKIVVEILQQSFCTMYASFKRIDSIGKCSILKIKWFRDANFNTKVLQMSVWFFISKLFQICVACACTPSGVWNLHEL